MDSRRGDGRVIAPSARRTRAFFSIGNDRRKLCEESCGRGCDVSAQLEVIFPFERLDTCDDV